MSGILIVMAVVVGVAAGVGFYVRRQEQDEPSGRSDVEPGEQESSPRVR